jgi:hypothetical protein
MFQDIKVSDDLNIEFLEYVKSDLSSTIQNQTMNNLIGLDFNIYVLQVDRCCYCLSCSVRTYRIDVELKSFMI